MNWNAFLLVLLLGSAVLAVIAGLFVVVWLASIITEDRGVGYTPSYIICTVCGIVYMTVVCATVAGVLS